MKGVTHQSCVTEHRAINISIPWHSELHSKCNRELVLDIFSAVFTKNLRICLEEVNWIARLHQLALFGILCWAPLCECMLMGSSER